jgi:hypothetical protein
MESENAKMYFNYPIKYILKKNIREIEDIESIYFIHLCIYKVNISGKKPFLQFLLLNDGLDLLSLPNLHISNLNLKDNLVSYAKVYISGILNIEDFNNLQNNIQFDGFYENKGGIYMFFDITNNDINIDETYSSSLIKFALVDEIINHKNVCNIPIANDTTKFFIENQSINYLFDENNNTYEIPIVGFVGKKTKEQINFTYIFGESAKDKLSIFGSSYYFTDFNNAVRQGGWSNDYKPEYLYNKLITDNENGRYIRGGLVRFALFMGKTLYIENNLNQPNDDSTIKLNKLNDVNLNKKYELMIMRISDHDSNWKNNYDSVYLGKLELDDGNYVEDYPIIAIKDYNQEVTLSYHFINKNMLGDKFDYCYDYSIV